MGNGFAAVAGVILAVALVSCSKQESAPVAQAPHAPPPAAATDAQKMAGHIIAARAAAITGDQRAVQQNVQALSDDMRRAMRVPDPARPINHESARAAVGAMQGTRAVAWLDNANMLVMVGGKEYRSMVMIDRICSALEPLGDTLAVVVNVQDATAKNSDDAATLSRNCQLPEGQRAFAQPKRQIDVVDPEVRRAFKAQQRAG